MRLEDFLRKAIGRSINISDRAENDWSWYEYKRHAELTSMIDFKCDFDQDGVCRNYLSSKKIDWKGNKRTKQSVKSLSMCCCGGCSGAVGHLRCLPNNISILESIAKTFDKKTGFWRPGKGCVLPRKYRSLTCLLHRCSTPFRKNHPFLILEGMLHTKWVREYRDGVHHRPPKRFQCDGWNSRKHRWVHYEKLWDLMNTEFEKDKQKKEKRSQKG